MGWKPFGSKDTIRKSLMKKNLYLGEPRSVIALRFGSGAIFPYSDGDPSVSPAPPSEHLYLGGGASVRGWVTDHLGPYKCLSGVECLSSNNTQISDQIIPLGGTASLYGGIEIRRYWAADYGVALFYDFGRVWDLPSNVNLDQISSTVGAGLRYKTSIGPLRLDLAYRIPSDPYFQEEQEWTFHFALAENF